MSVTQVHEALGQFSIEMLGNVPREVLDNISHFDHIAIIPGRMDPRQYGDGCLNAARYVGVVRLKRYKDDGRTKLIQDDISIEGVGMEFWLGDDDGKGAVIETAQEFNSASFTTVINALRPASVSNGTIYTVTGSYVGRHVYETPRNAIKYVCDTMSTTAIPVGYRVNNNGSLDAGPESSLFVTNPTCVIVRKGGLVGEDLFVKALPTNTNMDIDMEDFSTRVVMLAESDGENLATGSADIATVAPGVNIYKDLFGNTLSLTKLVNESDTLETNADTRAELALREVIDPHRNLQTSLDDYDVHGSFTVGDYVWFYDPDGGIVDTANEVYIRGVRLNPMKLRVTDLDWPVTSGYTVAHRDKNGTWTDLTQYVHFEQDQPTQVTIGDFSRDLTASGSPIADRTNPVIVNNTIPASGTWVLPFTTANYLDGNGLAKASIAVSWNTPLNTDGSAMTDGERYELNVRKSGDTLWTAYNVAWGTNSFIFNDLSVAQTYEFRFRAFDSANNFGGWSSTQSQLSSSDSIAPSTPAAPTVAASTVAVQITHTLGKSSGGTYNLENDLAELEVHMSTTNGFTPSASGTYIGSMRANKGMMAATAPAIQTFQVANTVAVYFKVIAVDTSGNKSAPSAQATTTALLIDDAHISNLVVDKVLAGTVSANWLLGANIQTAATGQRVSLNQTGLHAFNSSGTELVTISASGGTLTFKTATSGARLELSATGLQTYNSSGTQTVNISSSDGSVSLLGQIVSGTSGKRLEIMPTSTYLPELRFYASTGSNYSFINSFGTTPDSWLGLNSGTYTDSGVTVQSTALLSTVASLATIRTDTSARYGGFVWAGANSLILGYNKAGTDGGIMTANGTSMTVGWDDGTDSTANFMNFTSGRTRHLGKWGNFLTPDTNEGIIVGSLSFASSISGHTITWGPTMDSALYGISCVRDSPVRYSGMTTTPSTTGASFDYDAATSGGSADQFIFWRM